MRNNMKTNTVPNEISDFCVAITAEKWAGFNNARKEWAGDIGCGKTKNNKKIFFYWGGKAGNLTAEQVKKLHAKNNALRFVRHNGGWYALQIKNA